MVSVSNQQSGTTYPRAGSREPTNEEKQVFVTALTNINNEVLSTTANLYQQEISITRQNFSLMKEQDRWIIA
jgi:hypothetical protein